MKIGEAVIACPVCLTPLQVAITLNALTREQGSSVMKVGLRAVAQEHECPEPERAPLVVHATRPPINADAIAVHDHALNTDAAGMAVDTDGTL